MAKKQKRDNNFVSQRDILNFRPVINFIEPDQIEPEELQREQPTTLSSIQSDTDKLISDYGIIQNLADAAQSKIDTRSKDLKITLDPIADAHIIAAVQRHFDDPNKTDITYDDYKECLGHINSQANFSTIDQNDVISASQDQFRTDFGPYATDTGRPELQPNVQSIQPLDLSNFQIQQLEKLLELLTPGITTISTKITEDAIKKII